MEIPPKNYKNDTQFVGGLNGLCKNVPFLNVVFGFWSIVEIPLKFFWLVKPSNIFLIFPPYFGEMIQFDEHIFQMGWNQQLVFKNDTQEWVARLCKND